MPPDNHCRIAGVVRLFSLQNGSCLCWRSGWTPMTLDLAAPADGGQDVRSLSMRLLARAVPCRGNAD